jgi:hypothetical protein
MLSSMRLGAVEEYISEEHVGAAYAVSASLGCTPHWNAEDKVLYLHSPLRDRSIILDVEPEELTGPHGQQALAAVEVLAEDLQKRLGAVGALVVETWQKAAAGRVDRWLEPIGTSADAIVHLQPRQAVAGQEIRVRYTYNSFLKSRELAERVAEGLRSRHTTKRIATEFLWNGLAAPLEYRRLNWKRGPSVLVEWVHNKSQEAAASGDMHEKLGPVLHEALEGIFMSTDSIPGSAFDETRFSRVMSRFARKHLEEKTNRQENSPESGRKQPKPQKGVASARKQRKHEGRAYASGEWVSSKELYKRSVPSAAEVALERQHNLRSFARSVRGG